jgi:2-polyprenyl-6-methoxyphenol hydroxylase-like FAD-dependent oxidoreductase
LPDRGQGLNNAIHDAAILGQELKKRSVASQSDVSSAVTAYEAEMWPRGKEAVMSSHHNTTSLHNWEMLLNSPLFTAGVKQKVVPEDPKTNLVKNASRAASFDRI